MKLVFDSLDEARNFLAEIDGEEGDTAATGTKRKRRTKAEIEAAKAAAVTVTGGTGGAAGFAPPPAPAAPPATGFAPAPAPVVAPATFAPPAAPIQVAANPLVGQIVQKTEEAVAAGHPLENVVGWFRTALGPEAAQANWEQMKAAFLPKAAEATLKTIAGQMGIPV